jgi:hypothetical protein
MPRELHQSIRRWQAGIATLAVIAAALAPTTGVRAAPLGCAPDADYSWSRTSSNKADMVPYATAPGGHTLSITITVGASISASIGGQLETDESVLIASAKESINAQISATLTASVSYSDSWKVPDDASYGELHAGANQYFSHWSYGHYTPACTWVVTSSGNANMPWHIPAFWSVTHN